MKNSMDIGLTACMQIKAKDHMVNAYLLPAPDAFDDGLVIGSITGRAATQNPQLFKRWVALMQEQVKTVIESASKDAGRDGRVIMGPVMTLDKAQKVMGDIGEMFDPANAHKFGGPQVSPDDDIAKTFEKVSALADET